jgi:hypothetical protein
MSTIDNNPFRPYATRRELAKGRRQMLVNIAITLAAAALAVVAHRTVGDERLVQMYVVGAVLYLVAALGSAIRWSNTPAFEPGE